MLGVAIAAGAKGEPVDRLLADLALARGENDQALAIYRQLLASHPDEALLLERAGIAALRLGRSPEATALLDRATRQPAPAGGPGTLAASPPTGRAGGTRPMPLMPGRPSWIQRGPRSPIIRAGH